MFLAVAFCVADKIYNPSSGEVMSFSKQEFGFVMTIVDLVIVLLTIILINLLDFRFKEYAHLFDKRNVEMRDFTVELHHMPNDCQYYGKDILLQAYLWEHIETHLRASFESPHVANEAKLEQLRREAPWEIADINFGKDNNREAELLTNLDKAYREKMAKIHEQYKLKTGPNPEEQRDKIAILSQEILDKIKDYKELKSQYVAIQEEKLYEQYEMTEQNGRKESDLTINKAYVTFRSMKGKKRFQFIFENCASLVSERPEEEEKKFFGKFFRIHEAMPPGSIQWKNQQYTLLNRMIRTIIIWAIAIAILALAFVLMVFFKDWNDSLKASASLDTKCPAKLPLIDLVYIDF